MKISITFIGVLVLSLVVVEAFVPLHRNHGAVFRPTTSLDAKKKKRRRRKQPPAGASAQSAGTAKVETPVKPTTTEQPVAPAQQVAQEAAASKAAKKEPAQPVAKKEEAKQPVVKETPVVEAPAAKKAVAEEIMVVKEETADDDMSTIADVASFKFEPDDAITRGIKDDESGSVESTDDPLVLPDIKDMLRKKEKEEELERIEEERKASIKKIKRSDKKAMTKLLETDPYADMDDSFFEKEEYGTVSALLGEGTKPFLGIPSGFLQVGHFIGALGIMLMAFVEYPGFPLTNLPTPVRGCLQGGLATVYAINAVLAVLATFKAAERGQSSVLWGVKTFSVGGLAFDQLTQLPTLEEVEEAKSRKGKRALNKRR